MRKNIIRLLTYFLFFIASISGMANGEPNPKLVKHYVELLDDKKIFDFALTIDANEAKALAEALKINKTLTELPLVSDPIGDEGATALAEALKINKTLTKLSLYDTQIGDVGAQALAESIKNNKTLTVLAVAYNNIGAVGSQALAEALKINKTLIELDLYNNPIDAAAKKEIERQLNINKNLPEILIAQWPKLSALFMGYKNPDSVIKMLPKDVLLEILQKVTDLEKK